MIHKNRQLSWAEKIKQKLLFSFRLNYKPVVQVHNGYGNAGKIILYGHVLTLSPMLRKTYRQNWLVNTFSMLRLFMVQPLACAKVTMEWEGTILKAATEDDGFFKFEWVPETIPSIGWHKVKVYLDEEENTPPAIFGTGEINIPGTSTHAFISDIDDTFLISHSSLLRSRLYVLFTKNARSRKPFEGVVNHYQLLAASGQQNNVTNPFFYVSSSEWNLYDFILEFSAQNKLPKGVYLLNQIKRFKEVWRTGQNKHSGKFIRIIRIIEAYPHLQFVLLGDDTQEDPNIYNSIVKHFPGKVFAVYIRRIHKNNYERVGGIVSQIVSAGVHCCYFTHSSEAVAHSKSVGLIRN